MVAAAVGGKSYRRGCQGFIAFLLFVLFFSLSFIRFFFNPDAKTLLVTLRETPVNMSRTVDYIFVELLRYRSLARYAKKVLSVPGNLKVKYQW